MVVYWKYPIFQVIGRLNKYIPGGFFRMSAPMLSFSNTWVGNRHPLFTANGPRVNWSLRKWRSRNMISHQKRMPGRKPTHAKEKIYMSFEFRHLKKPSPNIRLHWDWPFCLLTVIGPYSDTTGIQIALVLGSVIHHCQRNNSSRADASLVSKHHSFFWLGEILTSKLQFYPKETAGYDCWREWKSFFSLLNHFLSRLKPVSILICLFPEQRL